MAENKERPLSEVLIESDGDQRPGSGRYGSFGSSEHDDQPSPDVLPSHTTPTRPASLTVVGLTYVVRERPGQWWNGSCFRSPRAKHVLNNLSMSFTQGELTALVGSSGSGKTSLLDVISGRAQGEVTGVVNYKHDQCTREMMKQKSSYVLQADRLLPTLTVRETLTYMAYLKLPGYMNASEIDAKVESVIVDMGLRHVAETRIGGAVVRGVSGGEKRRITIGVQLLRDPEILLLDEPTSGLDAFTARHLVSSLAELAHKGKLVIMSIHQPRSDIFYLLDKLAILTVGQLAFLGRPNQLVPYFTSIGHPCPRDQNPCDVYIDQTSVDRRTPTVEKKTMRKARRLCETFANSEIMVDILKRITSGFTRHDMDHLDIGGPGRRDRPSWGRKVQCLLSRMNVNLWRDRAAFLGRLIFLPLFIPFILMFLGRLGHNQGSIQDRLGLVYQLTQITPYIGVMNGVGLFPVLRDVFYRECHDGLYSTITFLLVYYFHSLPFNIVACAVFCPIIYWCAGMNDDIVVFGCFILVSVMLLQFGEMMTISILGFFRNNQLANNTACLIMFASGVLASGIMRSIQKMPQLVQWLGRVAIHKYSTEIIVGNEFHNLNFDCNLQDQGLPCVKTGDEFINLYYPDALQNETRNFVLMGSYCVAVLLFAFVMFKARGIPILH